MARQLGYTEEQLAALDRWREEGEFDGAARAALEYAEAMTRDAHTVSDAMFAGLRTHYTDRQILELTCVIGLVNYWNRFSTALRIDLSGSNEPYDPPGEEG